MSQDTGSDKLEFVYDNEQRYACTDCPAKCCRMPWNIDVTAEEYRRYHDTPWIRERLEAAGVDLLKKDSGYIMPRVQMTDGSYGCVFLDEDNMCAMQKAEGHTFIPQTCQDYPTSYIRDGDTVYQTTSYYCPSILHNYGDLFTEDSVPRRFEQFTGKGQSAGSMPATKLLGGIRLQKAAYLLLLDTLQGLVERPDLSVDEALLAGRRLMWDVMLTHLGQDTLNADELAATLDELLPGLETAPPQSVSAQPLTAQALFAMEALVVVLFQFQVEYGYQDFHEQTRRGNVPLSVRWFSLKSLLKLLLERGQVKFWGVEQPVDLAQTRQATVDMHQPEVQAHLKRYYRNLFRSRILIFMAERDEDLLKTYFFLGLSYTSIVKWARYFAAINGRAQATPDDVKEATAYTDLCVSSSARLAQSGIDRIKNVILDLLSAREGPFERLLYAESPPRQQENAH